MIQHTHRHPHVSTCSRLKRFNQDLQLLAQEYGSYLVKENLSFEVQHLKDLVTDYQNGSFQAAKELHDHGSALLEAIKLKLKASSRELQRMDNESPSSKYVSNGKSDHLNNAVSLSVTAEQHLKEALTGEDNAKDHHEN